MHAVHTLADEACADADVLSSLWKDLQFYKIGC